MGKRTFFEDIAYLALLLRYDHLGLSKIEYSKVLRFDRAINDILDQMHSPLKTNFIGMEDNELYDVVKDENGKCYIVIKDGAEKTKDWQTRVGILPLDVLKAAFSDTALETINLQSIDNVLCYKPDEDELKR